VEDLENFCGPIIQTASFCFERTENHLRGECHCGVGCAAVGHLKQLSFADKFLIEDMDYSFLDHTCVKYHTEEPFLELLCLDSIDAVNCEYENGEFPILNGIYVNLNQGKAGELHFLPGTPVRGIRVIVKEAFYNAYVKSRFPRDDLDIPYLTGMYGNSHRNPKLYMIFKQIRDSISAGVNSEITTRARFWRYCIPSPIWTRRPSSANCPAQIWLPWKRLEESWTSGCGSRQRSRNWRDSQAQAPQNCKKILKRHSALQFTRMFKQNARQEH
jgi:hypothetical protein